MAKILIVYGSTTGNTQSVAEEIEKVLAENGNEVSIFSGNDVSAEEIKNYDFSFIGSSTWGDGEIQDDMLDFVEQIKKEDLSGKSVAVFATGMTSFPQFCHAGEIIENSLKESGANIATEMFKIDGDVFGELENVSKWALEAI